MQPSLFLANSGSRDTLQPQLRVILAPEIPQHDYRRGAVVTLSGTIRASATGVVLQATE
jgi:hypothetical protein